MGGAEMMKILEYSKDYALYIEEILKNRFENVFLINTPIVPENIQIERQRPKSFFKQLYVTNKFIENIILMDKKFNLIDIKNINHTFDAVHYTSKGHNEVFLKIIKKLNL